MQLFHRPRRLRKTDWSRRLVQENQLSSNDFIYPVFCLRAVAAKKPFHPCRALVAYLLIN